MGHHLFHTVLVANRGEIAVRVIRTLRGLGIRSVAVHSESDAGALHVREADLALCIGPGPASLSYLDIDAVVDACVRSGAQAVHPGYGFLAENAAFARALEAAGIVFIGPGPEALELMGDKIRAKNHVSSHGVPVVPGVAEPGMDDAALGAAADRVGFPLLIKPSAGGGGKGMQAVERPQDLPAALASARRVARNAFGDDTLLLERLVRSPRHIEVQVLADGFGHTIHLGERECSLQRRHQKVVEEAPSPLLEGLVDGAEIRARIGAAAVDAAKSVGYVGAGTVEFLVSDEDPDEFFFMEMNTRLQVEHPVTEEVVRIGPEGRRMDLVEWQVRIAAGERLEVAQADVVLHGHAVEARVYAEDPAEGFLPSTGRIFHYRAPAGPGVRVDSMLAGDAEVSPHYDPMIGKIIASGAGRGQAMARLVAALAATVVLGVRTNLEYLRALLDDADVRAGRLDTTLIDRLGPVGGRSIAPVELAAVAHRLLRVADGAHAGRSGSARGTDSRAGSVPLATAGSAWVSDGWRVGGPRTRAVVLESRGALHEVGSLGPAPGDSGAWVFGIDGGRYTVADLKGTDGFTVNGVSQHVTVRTDPADPDGRTAWISSGGFGAEVRWLDRRELLRRRLAAVEREQGEADPAARAPMPGTVVSLAVATGDRVEAGQLLLGVEAMKMEHPLTAAVAGTVTLHTALGDQVKKGQVLASVHPGAGTPSEPHDPAHPTEGN